MNTLTRQKLLAAAVPLAEELQYDELSLARLCAAAGVSRHDFMAEFSDLSEYFQALQVEFLDGLRTRMLKMTAGTTPGLLRIKLASEGYLAYCLDMAKVLRWLLASRSQPAVMRIVNQQSRNYELMLSAELRAANCARVDAVARLYLAMLNAVASVEMRGGQRQPAYREALWHFLDHAGFAAQRNAA